MKANEACFCCEITVHFLQIPRGITPPTCDHDLGGRLYALDTSLSDDPRDETYEL